MADDEGKVPVAAPVVGLRTRLEAVSWTRLTTTAKLAPEPTEKMAVGLPYWGSTDQSRAPVGENLSTAVP